MNRNELFEKLMRLERNVGQLTQDMTELKDLAVELVEENVALQVENDNLKRLMDKGEASSEHNDEKSHSKHIKTPSPSKDNLAMLYREGFHICKGELFGKHRQGEDCLLCLNVLSD
ncbi:DNA replication initiation control protein YabA [Staphylococcus caprae]|uniref:DNA replication initiation control protein YabA n=1 Tax=Staphylococcus caprae TaxID=29380 RepID=UPI001C83AABB|nr:DNA replication initiation control protein YabA [Staphylococcus caprae]MBX5320156.1 DNA replication initiation control protein YabA [Staphylococcus caprae]MDI9232094.1 DNA replication initiation control protein YabA [Staphylococcus caprae]